jgi:hypothetical protein
MNMSPRIRSLLAILALAGPALGCLWPTDPLHSDIDRAYAAWTRHRAPNYRFDVQITSFAGHSEGWHRVTVYDGQPVEVIDPSGQPLAEWHSTIDSIWEHVLSAQAQGEVNKAVFDNRGVPVELDVGSWVVDSGVRYAVRAYTPLASPGS